MDDDLTPKDNKEYKTKEYWDQRYQKYFLSFPSILDCFNAYHVQGQGTLWLV